MIKILVLGGSYMQSGLIETALESSYSVTVLDRDPNCLYANDKRITFSPIDIADIKALDSFLENNSFDAYLAPVSEVGNITLSKLAQKYGFNYNSEETVRLTTNKIAIRKKLKFVPKQSAQFYTLKEIKERADDISFPLIVKPAQSSASRGVTLVERKEELPLAISYALEYCTEEEVLIEKYATGQQFSIETISQNGQHAIVAVVEENMSPAPYFIERSDIINIDQQEVLKKQLGEFVNNLLDAIKVKVGPCHIEVKIDKDEVFLIEIASRSGLLRDRLISAANLANYDQLIIDSYLNVREIIPLVENLDKKHALLNILLYEHDIKIYNEAKIGGFIQDEYFYPNKKTLSKEIKLTDAYGYFFVKSEKFSEIQSLRVSQSSL